jgi:hypothetical protein
MLIWDLNAKVKLKFENENLYKISADNRVRAVNFSTFNGELWSA